LRDNWQQALEDRGDILRGSQEYELALRPDPGVYDGRFTNNGWLMEWPRPLTKLTWDNAAIVSPATARELGVIAGLGPHGGGHGEYVTELVTLTVGGRS